MNQLTADLIVTGGNLITLDSARPRAQAMAVRDGRIVSVGADQGIKALAGPGTQHLDLEGKTVTPGFCDSHIHLFMYGAQLLTQADLVGTKSIPEILDRLSQQMRKSDGWIQGSGFDQEKLNEKRFPTREELDSVSRTRPIIIARICGHAVVVNSAAIALLSKTDAARGDAASGLYCEVADEIFYSQVPPLDQTQMQEAVLAAAKIALRTGITSVQTLLDTPDQMQAYSALYRQGKLPLRVTGIPPYSAVQQLHTHGINTGFGNEWLRFGGAKLFSDGSLGAQTALLSSPYTDKPGTLGIRIYDPEDLKRKCRDAQSKGFQVAIHAIGDQALRETLDGFEYALQGESNEIHRHRVEHAAICSPDLLERMARNKIVATFQPQFVTSDTWTPERIGAERLSWAYPMRSMIEAGVPVSLSSDCPVEKLDAFAAIASAVGRDQWTLDERLTPEQAIGAYCMGSAYAGFAEHYSGSLEAGKVADFVVLSDDPTKLPADKIARLTAERVFIAGKPAGTFRP